MLRKFLETCTTISWKQPLNVEFIELTLLPVFKDVAFRHKFEATWENVPHYFAFMNSKIKPTKDHLKSLPIGFTIGQLKPEHAALVNRYWKYYDPNGEALIRFQIQHLPSVCIYNEKGEPVSWISTMIDGSLAIGYTIPEYRRMGLYNIGLNEMTFRQNQMKSVSFGYVETGNTPSLKATSKTSTFWQEAITWVRFAPIQFVQSKL